MPSRSQILFDGVSCHVGSGQEEWTCNSNCNDCFADKCYEFMFGPYCVAAVKRYFEENSYCATTKDAYTVFVAHYNRRLDIHSFECSTAETIRQTEISNLPTCMMQGSLKYCIHWLKWQMAHSSYSGFYVEEEKRRKAVMASIEQKRQMDKKKDRGVL